MSGLVDTAIIVRGISVDVEEVKNCFKDYSNHIIFSTWVGEEGKYNQEDKVVYSPKLIQDGPRSFIFQRTTVLAGLDYAQKLNYKYAIVVRFDTLFNPADKIIELFDFEKLNFLCWHKYGPGYIVDYISAGKIEYIKTMWSVFENYPSQTAEHITTSQYFQNLVDKVEIKFILNQMDTSRDIFWKKYNIMLSVYKNYPEYSAFGGIKLINK